MAGYMKTKMPFYGVYKPGSEEIAALVAERFAITMDEWIDAEDLWVRRSGLLSQIRHKRETDAYLLFVY